MVSDYVVYPIVAVIFGLIGVDPKTLYEEGVAAAAHGGDPLVWFVFTLLAVIALGLYFLPSIVVFAYNKPNKIAILALNLFLGWSVVGWVISLIWAISAEPPAQQEGEAIGP